jgi:hypothetical protein
MRERLERIADEAVDRTITWPEDTEAVVTYSPREIVDAILAELREPTEGMAIAGAKAMEGWKHNYGTVIVGQPKAVFQAMVDHIREEKP